MSGIRQTEEWYKKREGDRQISPVILPNLRCQNSSPLQKICESVITF